MSNTDQELFELCKQVYEKTGWKDTLQCIWNEQVSMPDKSVVDYGIESSYKGYSPLYTSDYLLEKLPAEIDKKLLVITNGDRPHVGYAERDNYGNYSLDEFFYKNAQYSDTTLKALLKLTLALSEAGEL